MDETEMATNRSKRRSNAKAKNDEVRSGDAQGADVGAEAVHLDAGSEPDQAVQPAGEGLDRLHPLPDGLSGDELRPTDAEGVSGAEPLEASGELRRDDRPEQASQESAPQQFEEPEPRLDAQGDRELLLNLASPEFADLAPVVVSWLQLAQHQFSLHLQAQGIHTRADGVLVTRELVERLRTEGVQNLALSAGSSPIADLERRASDLAEIIALKISSEYRPAPMETTQPQYAAQPLPAAPTAPAPTAPVYSNTRYPLGRMLAGNGGR